MSDISEMVKRLRSITRECAPQYFSDSIINDAADALEAQAKEIKIYQQTELTYVTRVADAQREYSEMQAKLKARIAELEALVEDAYREGWSDGHCSDGSNRNVRDEDWKGSMTHAALKGEKR